MASSEAEMAVEHYEWVTFEEGLRVGTLLRNEQLSFCYMEYETVISVLKTISDE